MQIGWIDKPNLAKTDEEFLELVESDVDWIARSANDVRQLREAQYGPFAKLPEDAFREFVESLEFRRRESNRAAVATGSYEPLMKSLSLTELFEVFECFGMSQELFLRSSDLTCGGKECEPFPHHFCSSFCPNDPI